MFNACDTIFLAIVDRGENLKYILANLCCNVYCDNLNVQDTHPLNISQNP